MPAIAADLPVKAPPPAPVWAWTGFYGGVNGGYSWGRWNTRGTAALFPDGAGGLTTAARPNVDGWLGGVQAGYNWQRDRWLLGIEADGQFTGERAKRAGSASLRLVEPGSDFNDVFTTTTNTKWKFPWFATFRGRLGLVASDTWLFYATGGLAVGDVKFSVSQTISCQKFGPGSTGTTPSPLPCAPPAGAPTAGTTGFSDSNVNAGIAVGGGIEKLFTRNWSVKAEYLYLDFGNHTFQVTPTTFTRIHARDNIVRLGINYHFDPAVVARY
jgi:outer membrane immunogenic protein